MSGLRLRAMADFLMRRGFLVVFIIVFLFFSVVTRHFFELDNILNILSAMAPLAISAAGLALVVMSGRLDISIGSIAFLSCAIGALLLRASGLSPVLAALIVVGCGALLGALNGFIVVVLRVNSLIATLSTMIAFRGIALAVDGCPARTIATRRSIHREREARTDTGRYPTDVPCRYSCSFASKSDGLWAPNPGDGQRYLCGSPTWFTGGSGGI